jgi:GxxExxY protein
MSFVRDPLVERVIGCAIEVHRHLGPGLLESAYQRCLAQELTLRGIGFLTQQALPLQYKGLQLTCGYRIDFLIERRLLVELKTAEHLLPLHHAQVVTYLKLLALRQGLLINFNVPRLVNGPRSVFLT